MVLGKQLKEIRLLVFIGICLLAFIIGVSFYGLSLSLLNIMAIPCYISFLALYRDNIFKIIRWYHFAYIILLTIVVSSYMIILANLVPEIRVQWTEVPLTVWFLISVHITIKIIDHGANALFSKFLRIKSNTNKIGSIILIKNFLRIACVILIGVPYLLSIFSVNWIKFSDNTNPGVYGLEFSEVQFETADGIKLEGWFIKPMRGISESTVIIAPGYGTTKSCFLSYALILSGNGHNVLLFDQRGQGASGGHIHSFGQLEANDIIEAVNFLKHIFPEESKYTFALGLSQGSAAVITAAAEDKRIRAVIVDSVIAESGLFSNHVADWLIWPMDKYITTTTGIFTSALLKYNLLSETNIYSDIAKISPRPVLIFHGAADTTSDYELVKKLYANAGQPKKLCVIPGAGHTQVLLYMRNEYMEEITDVFIESMLVR